MISEGIAWEGGIDDLETERDAENFMMEVGLAGPVPDQGEKRILRRGFGVAERGLEVGRSLII